ncbi:MAG TPA: PAS domain-containing protein, partial [Gemmatimonas sp.]|nr:PAS domain-containing protein [Gemmatimonas sp.]
AADYAQVLAGEPPVVHTNVRHTMVRNGDAEDTWWTYTDTPVFGDDGAIAGVLTLCEETTARVLTERRHAASLIAVEEAERHVARVLDQVADRYLTMDPEFRILTVNAAAERAIGLSASRISGRTHWEAFPTSVGSAVERQYRRAMQERVPVQFAHHYVGHGYDLHVEIDVYPTDDGGLAVFWRDVTERVRAAAALAESERRFRTVQDASPMGFGIHRAVRDDDGRVVDFAIPYINAAGARLVSRSREVVQAGTMLAMWPGTAEAGVLADLTGTLMTGAPSSRELLYERDGVDAGLAITAVRIGEGADAELGDVTARLRAERERDRLFMDLGAERERLRSVILNMPAPLALLEGPEHRYTLVNDAYRRVSGGGRDITGPTPRQAYPELAGQGILEKFDEVFATGEPWAGAETLALYDRNGTGVIDTWFNLRYEPLRAADGRVTGILNFAVDVTEQVRARREVEGLLAESEAARAGAEVARGEAQAANQAKSQFLATMSHELRTPLNAIGGYTELIELGIHGPVTDAQRAALERIQQSQRHLLGLIAGVLDYSRVEAGAVTYRMVDVPVTEAVAEAEALLAPQLRAKGLGYTWSGAAPGLTVRADREKLQQILLNLLSNAVKFTALRDGMHGRIEVSCTVEANDAGEAAGGRVCLQIRDTGEGIAGADLERIFEPFVQVDQRLTRAYSGVGLGLAISRDLARGMEGDLTAESTLGLGSTFTLTLPASVP